MHPEPTTASSIPLHTDPSAAASHSSQHGTHPIIVSPRRGSRAAGEGPGGVAVGSPRSSDNANVRTRSPTSGSSSPDKNDRISRYEAQAWFSGSGFVVTRTNWAGKDPANSPIIRFPNEVLVHTLSFLEPSNLISVSLVSRRFNALTNSPHSWRAAFSRYFPAPFHELGGHEVTQDRRYFTPLSLSTGAHAWRNEYTQRTTLLRSLGKGKLHAPDGLSRAGQGSGGLMVTYPSVTGQTSVSHMAANFAPSGVRCVHASLESQYVSASDGITGKPEKRPRATFDGGLINMRADAPELRSVRNDHTDFAVGAEMNVNRVMDISEDLGWIMGENSPDGVCYVHPYHSPYPSDSNAGIMLDAGNEKVTGHKPSITCVWIAKRRRGGICETTDGCLGIVVGNSRGVIRIYKIAYNPRVNGAGATYLSHYKTFQLCPGVPIVDIKIDDDYLPRRQRQRRPWIVVINALGEVYYMRHSPPDTIRDEDWKMVPQTARVATSAYHRVFPESFTELAAEQLERRGRNRKEELMKMDYYTVKELWDHCRMDWFVEVDWAGQNIVVGRKGVASYWYGTELEKADAPMTRYHLRVEKQPLVRIQQSHFAGEEKSIFGGITADDTPAEPTDGDTQDEVDDWQATVLTFGTNAFTRITALAFDESTLARITPEDYEKRPGSDGRFFAVGTNAGIIFVFNIRPTSHDLDARELPIRTIHTDSPQITTLAVSSLIVVHGGDDGLVQAWDPLASTLAPVRTLHSRFSAKARRRIEQTATHGQATTDNQFAARCLVLDGDATRLRGVVALGTFIRYWSFSATSLAADAKKKRRKFAGTRRGAGTGGSTPNRNKGDILERIETEADITRRQRARERKEAAELEKRYGIAAGRAALNEEEMTAYALMLSQETFEAESSGRSDRGSTGSSVGSTASSVDSTATSRTITPEDAPSVSTSDDGDDPALAEALRLSLLEAEQPSPPLPAPSVAATNGDDEGLWEDASSLLLPPTAAAAAAAAAAGPSVSSPPLQMSSQKPSPRKGSQGSSPNGGSSAGKSPKRKGWEKLDLNAPDEWPSVGVDKDKGKGKGGAGAFAAHSSSSFTKSLLPPQPPQPVFEDDLELAIRLSLMEEQARSAGAGEGRAAA